MVGARGSLMALSIALGCASQDAVAPEVAAPSIAVDSGAGARSRALQRIGSNDEKAQRCFAIARASGAAGSSVRSDEAQCVDGARAACAQRCNEGEANACRRLAVSFAGTGDKGCADKLFDLACTHAEHSACVSLALLLDGAKERTRIVQLLSRSCQAGHAPGCTQLGARVLEDGDRARGDGLLLKGCDRGDADGCRRAAALREGKERIDLVRKACNLGDPPACVDLARILQFGMKNHGIDPDPPAAQRILQQVCSLDGDEDRGEACFLLASLLGKQPGADALHKRACDKGQVDGCVHVVRAHYHAARYQEAITLATKLIDTGQGANWMTRFVRGMSLFDVGRFAEAIPDLEQMCTLRPEDVYCHLWLFIARERSSGDGKSALATAAKTLDTSQWPAHVIPFFLGKTNEGQLVREAKHADRQKELEQLCEAYFYAAELHMIRGKTKEAAVLFQKSIDTGITEFVEFDASRAELARLRP